MHTRIQKWGNSLAIRIPKSFAAEVGLDQDSVVELSLLDGKLILMPITRQPVLLAALLAQITDDNLHSEVSTGEAVGNEGW
jgi:antitoxin MazE